MSSRESAQQIAQQILDPARLLEPLPDQLTPSKGVFDYPAWIVLIHLFLWCPHVRRTSFAQSDAWDFQNLFQCLNRQFNWPRSGGDQGDVAQHCLPCPVPRPVPAGSMIPTPGLVVRNVRSIRHRPVRGRPAPSTLQPTGQGSCAVGTDAQGGVARVQRSPVHRDAD